LAFSANWRNTSWFAKREAELASTCRKALRIRVVVIERNPANSPPRRDHIRKINAYLVEQV
jgi:hypothetical protein